MHISIMTLSKQSSYKFLKKGRYPKVDETVLLSITNLCAKCMAASQALKLKAGEIAKSQGIDENY